MTINKYLSTNTWQIMTEPRFNFSQQHNANSWCAVPSAIPKQDRLLLK